MTQGSQPLRGIALPLALAFTFFVEQNDVTLAATELRVGTSVSASDSSPAKKRKVVCYRNPMGLPDTSATPKKDPMGMDYVPVYEDEAGTSGTVEVSPQRLQTLGVKIEPVRIISSLTRTIKAAGTVALDERSMSVVTTRAAGWVETLRVAAMGEQVKKGQTLLDFYSPDLVTAEEEYLIAASIHAPGAASMEHGDSNALARASIDRLQALGVPDGEIARLKLTGKASRLIPVAAAADGIVLEKPAAQGMRVEPGMPLYKTADLSTVWLMADIQEQDIGQIKRGQKVSASFVAFPGRSFDGTIDLIPSMLSAQMRTASVRIVAPNPALALRAGMYGTINIRVTTAPGAQVIVVPNSAIIDSGAQQFVLVEKGLGKFEPREVHLGGRGDGVVQVLSGVKEGELVVVSANFLIDAESNLRAALRTFTVNSPCAPRTPPAGETK
jgi:Cu(I)/Ag(I) efflux system membrane fusion protein